MIIVVALVDKKYPIYGCLRVVPKHPCIKRVSWEMPIQDPPWALDEVMVNCSLAVSNRSLTVGRLEFFTVVEHCVTVST